MRDLDRANLKGSVRTVTTERKSESSVLVEELAFDTDGRFVSAQSLRDGVPVSHVPTESVDYSIKSVHHADGSRTDTQQVIGIDAWSMEGLSVALGTHGAAVARTTFDRRGAAVETVFLNAKNEETAKIRYACDERGRILQAVQTLGPQTLGPGFGPSLPVEALAELLALLPDGEWCRLSFHYDEAGRVTESTSYLLGKQSHHEVTTYNDQGDKETVTTDEQGMTRFEYNYDSQGNWIRQIIHHPAGDRVETRLITYY